MGQEWLHSHAAWDPGVFLPSWPLIRLPFAYEEIGKSRAHRSVFAHERCHFEDLGRIFPVALVFWASIANLLPIIRLLAEKRESDPQLLLGRGERALLSDMVSPQTLGLAGVAERMTLPVPNLARYGIRTDFSLILEALAFREDVVICTPDGSAPQTPLDPGGHSWDLRLMHPEAIDLYERWRSLSSELANRQDNSFVLSLVNLWWLREHNMAGRRILRRLLRPPTVSAGPTEVEAKQLLLKHVQKMSKAHIRLLDLAPEEVAPLLESEEEWYAVIVAELDRVFEELAVLMEICSEHQQFLLGVVCRMAEMFRRLLVRAMPAQVDSRWKAPVDAESRDPETGLLAPVCFAVFSTGATCGLGLARRGAGIARCSKDSALEPTEVARQAEAFWLSYFSLRAIQKWVRTGEVLSCPFYVWTLMERGDITEGGPLCAYVHHLCSHSRTTANCTFRGATLDTQELQDRGCLFWSTFVRRFFEGLTEVRLL